MSKLLLTYFSGFPKYSDSLILREALTQGIPTFKKQGKGHFKQATGSVLFSKLATASLDIW